MHTLVQLWLIFWLCRWQFLPWFRDHQQVMITPLEGLKSCQPKPVLSHVFLQVKLLALEHSTIHDVISHPKDESSGPQWKVWNDSQQWNEPNTWTVECFLMVWIHLNTVPQPCVMESLKCQLSTAEWTKNQNDETCWMLSHGLNPSRDHACATNTIELH